MLKKSSLTLVLSAAALACGQTSLAPRPPMGWNSWDAYGLTITEQQFRDNVDVLAKTLEALRLELRRHRRGLVPARIRWSADTPTSWPTRSTRTDATSRCPTRFPSALDGRQNTGFAALGEYVHAQGLKFGIHIVRGIPRESVRTQPADRRQPLSRARTPPTQTDACPWDPTNWGVKDTPAGQAWYDSLLRAVRRLGRRST